MSSLVVQTALVLLGVVLVGLPLLTFLHELGHALAAALLIGGRVTVVQGPSPARVSVPLWRLDLRLHGPVRPHQVWVGWAVWGAHPDHRRHALALAAGPFTSGLSAGLCIAGAIELSGLAGLALVLLAVGSALQMLSSGLPVRYGRYFGTYAGKASDGLRIRRLLEGRPERTPLV